MIRVLILYYLSIKATHGYEIQKFIQINHLDKWTKIQSGSIYYAISKLEKQGLIELLEEVGTGQKAKKVYQITENGRVKLIDLVQKELENDISVIGSDKFIIYPILNGLDEEVIISTVNDHLQRLHSKKDYMQSWKKAKITSSSLKVEAISFDMMIGNISNQILWHEALLEQLPECMKRSREIFDLIKRVDFSDLEASELPPTNGISKGTLLDDLENFTK